MYLRPRKLAAILIFLLLTALGAAAQSHPPQNTNSPFDQLSDGITVRVLGPDNTPLNQQAFVTLYKFGSGTALATLTTKTSSEVVFANLPGFGMYTVAVDSSGYATARKDFEYNMTFTRISVDIVVHPVAGADVVLTPVSVLPPKVQKHVEKGREAMQAGKFEEAQREFTEAHNADSKNAYVCYLLGAAYQKGKDLPHAQMYLEMASSLDPRDVQTLVALGQLRHQQKDDQAAIEPLQKAAALDPKQWLARWVLSDIYLRGGEYEKARQNAHEAVELGKGAANKAELIEGQALAQLGRREEAVKVLEAFLRDLPGDPAAPAVRALIAKLQSSTQETPRNPDAK